MLKVIYAIYRMIFAKVCFSKLNKFLYNCSLRGLGVYNYENMDVSGETFFIEKFVALESMNKGNFVVFDVGANIGDYSKIISKKIGNAEIYSFEPHPKTFLSLKENCQNISNIKLYNCALSSDSGELELFDYKSNEGSQHASLSSEIFSTVHNSETNSYKVDVQTIDLICKKNNINAIDFLKIDVEGYEFDVLKGAKEMLDNNKIKFIQFEFTQLNTTTRIFFKDFWEMLSGIFKIYRLLPNNLLEIKEYNSTCDEIFGYQNFIAIHKDMKNGI